MSSRKASVDLVELAVAKLENDEPNEQSIAVQDWDDAEEKALV